MSKKRGDIVYTPDWVAKDMVDFFSPSGSILEPCKGDGVFLKFLPSTTEWCELQEGRDFFEWMERVDWIISNPPYSKVRPWFRHSYEIADNIVYLVPLRNVFSGYGFIREIYAYGGIRHIRVYGTGGRLGFPMGNAIGAMHLQRDYIGDVGFSLYSESGDSD